MRNNIDIDTLKALREGNHEAFETVFTTYYNKTKFFLYGYLKSEVEAEELAEDLFVNLWEKRESIDLDKSFNSYLHTIARNAALNFLKRKFLHAAYIDSSMTSEQYGSTSEEDLIAKELGLLIDDIVERMPEQRRRIYILSKEKGFSNTEIAEQLNTTKRNVESQLSLALKEIRKAISIFFFTLL